MSYGLNIEMHKQVRPFSLPIIPLCGCVCVRGACTNYMILAYMSMVSIYLRERVGQVGRKTEDRQPGRKTEDRQPGRNREDREVGRKTEDRQLGGETDVRQAGRKTEEVGRWPSARIKHQDK